MILTELNSSKIKKSGPLLLKLSKNESDLFFWDTGYFIAQHLFRFVDIIRGTDLRGLTQAWQPSTKATRAFSGWRQGLKTSMWADSFQCSDTVVGWREGCLARKSLMLFYVGGNYSTGALHVL